MPNWCTGTLKVRGKKESILRLLAEFTPFLDVEIIDSETIRLKSNEKHHAFGGVRRTLIDYELNETIDINPNKLLIIVFEDVDIAWGMAAEDHGWTELSKKYDVDFRWHGFEMGMQFHQDTEIINGVVTKDIAHKYNGNYEWDCPHPNWGG